MTAEMCKALSVELKAAVESGETARIDRTQANIMIALMDCQAKTAARVKELAASSWKLKAALVALAASIGGGISPLLKFLLGINT